MDFCYDWELNASMVEKELISMTFLYHCAELVKINRLKINFHINNEFMHVQYFRNKIEWHYEYFWPKKWSDNIDIT